MHTLNHYVIDWDKVKTQEDIVIILKELFIFFEKPSDELKPLCKYVNKMTGEEVKEL